MTQSIDQVMTKSPITISNDASLEDAKQLMYRSGIRHLPVVAGKSLFGILSDRDIKLAFAVDSNAGAYLIDKLCTREVCSVLPDTSVPAVCAQMVKGGIGSVVVVDQANSVLGIFTSMDACRLIADGYKPS